MIGDLEVRAGLADELRPGGQELQHESCGVSEAGPERLVRIRAPVGGVDGECAKTRGGWGHDQTLGISKARREAFMQLRPAGKVAGVGRDQAAAPLTLGKSNLVAGGVCDLS